jgi:photosystem II stability/assembly factor-like uncharacterized protein
VQQSSGTDQNIDEVDAVDAHLAWAIVAGDLSSGIDGRVLRTTDGGHTWR